jgi:hypothetical protein
LSGRRERFLLCATLAVLAASCGGMSGDIAAAWEKNLGDVIVSGHTRFRAESDGSEDGVYVFSYELPELKGSSLDAFKDHVVAHDACLQVREQSADEVVLRCSQRRVLPSRPMEVRAAVSRNSRRLFVMYSQDVPHSGYVLTFRQMASRSRE